MISLRTGNPCYFQYVQIKEIHKDKKTITFYDGKSQFTKSYLSFYKLSKEKITDVGEKTTRLKLSEAIANKFIDQGCFEHSLQIRMQAAQSISVDGPLANIHLQAEDLKLGFRLQPVDTSLFKNQSLTVQNQTFIDGSTKLHIEGKLSHPVREQLQNTLNRVKQNPENFFEYLPKGFCTKVKVTQETTTFYGRTEKEGTKFEGPFSSDVPNYGYQNMYGSKEIVIHFEGIGKVRIGNDEFLTLRNRIQIDLDAGITKENAAEKLHIIFASLGLGAVSSSPRGEDIERIKVMQLFRVFYPRKAYDFERDSNSFEESIDSLKIRIIAKVPDMESKFKNYLNQMVPQEVYPGQSIWAVKGLAEEVRKEGGLGLMSGLYDVSFDVAMTRIISILKTGALSTLDRFQAGIIAPGASTDTDLRNGGADQVFTRLITDNMSMDPEDYLLAGNVQILYDLDLVGRGGFAYSADKFGTKEQSDYQNRPNIIELTQKLKAGSPKEYISNEVCIKNRIPPKFIKGVMVKDQTQKDQLVAALRTAGLMTPNKDGEECINLIPIDKFIHIGNFKKEYWA